MRRLIISLVALVTMQSVFAVDRLSSLPCPILGGELSNSAATSVADIDEVMPRMKALGLNTVLVPAYWEFIEPLEGKFDFTLIDRTIDVARQEQLHVVFLWFGSSTSPSSTAPSTWRGRSNCTLYSFGSVCGRTPCRAMRRGGSSRIRNGFLGR